MHAVYTLKQELLSLHLYRKWKPCNTHKSAFTARVAENQVLDFPSQPSKAEG